MSALNNIKVDSGECSIVSGCTDYYFDYGKGKHYLAFPHCSQTSSNTEVGRLVEQCLCKWIDETRDNEQNNSNLEQELLQELSKAVQADGGDLSRVCVTVSVSNAATTFIEDDWDDGWSWSEFPYCASVSVDLYYGTVCETCDCCSVCISFD